MLKFTTTTPFGPDDKILLSSIHLLVTPPDSAHLISSPVRGRNAYITGNALRLAGNSLPCFFDGDIKELDEKEGEIFMVLPSGEYPIVSKLDKSNNYTLDLR